MNKIRIILGRLKDISLARLKNTIKGVRKQKNIPGIFILLDMVYCYLKYGTGYFDYYNFGFVNLNAAKRSTYMTMLDNNVLVLRLDDQEKRKLFEDKIEFLRTFGDYLGREWIDLRESGKEGFREFVIRHPVFFAKSPGGFGGLEVRKIKTDGVSDPDRLFDELSSVGMWCIEEPIIQHAEMDKLCPDCVNTIRMTTLIKDGVPHLMYALVRIGAGGKEVDNVSSGGYHANLDGNGVISGYAHHEKSFSLVEKHHLTGTVFHGFQIPMFQQAREMVLKAAMVVPEVRYVGWDVAITEKGPVLVEGNTLPGYDMCQNYGQTQPDGMGIKPRFKELLGNEFPG